MQDHRVARVARTAPPRRDACRLPLVLLVGVLVPSPRPWALTCNILRACVLASDTAACRRAGWADEAAEDGDKTEAGGRDSKGKGVAEAGILGASAAPDQVTLEVEAEQDEEDKRREGADAPQAGRGPDLEVLKLKEEMREALAKLSAVTDSLQQVRRQWWRRQRACASRLGLHQCRLLIG